MIGERAKRISDVDQTGTFVMSGNWLWADIVPHWDRFEIV